ncbi:MAG TPA: MFS transporter [Tissierellia bacterium]|jgi:MFS family permease|nr:MFS transporter [Tissierellia bacterium]
MTRKFHYRYLVAFICFIIAFFYVGYANNSASLYVVPVTSHFGFTRAEFSLVFSIVSIVGIFANLAFTFLYRRLGINKLVVFGTALSALGYFVYYKSTKLLHFYVGAFLFGTGFTYANMLSFSVIVNSWFTENKGIVFGLISAGSGFGGSVMSPIIGYIISVYGFKWAYLLTFIILSVLVVPTALFIKENENFEYEGTEDEIIITRKTTGELLREKTVVLGLTVIFLMGFLMAPWLNVVASHLIDRGFDGMFASQILSGILFIMGFSKIMVGSIYDRIGIKGSISICLVSFVFSGFLLLFVKSKLMAWFFAAFFGISLSALSVLLPLFTSAIAGDENLNSIIGIASALIALGMALGTPLINIMYDLTGTNNIMILIFTIFGIFNMFLAIYVLKEGEKKVELKEQSN